MKEYYSHYKALAKLGFPIIIGQLGTIVLGFADTLMIGHHSTNELAAAAFVNSMFVLALIFALGFSYGTTPIVGNLFGRNMKREIGGMVKNALVANTVLAAVLVAVMTVVYLNIGRLGQPKELQGLILPYFLINLLSLPFVCWFNVFKQFYDGITDTRTPMWILIGGNILNIAGNYVLIYGKMGFPEMGLAGAGISTLVSRIVMCLSAVVLSNASPMLLQYRDGFHAGKVNRKDFSLLNRIGWPLAAQMGMETAAFSLTGVMVGWLGTTALAAHQVMLTVSQLFYMVYYGMAAAVAVRVSYFFGQCDYRAANRSTKAGFHIILVLATCVSIPVILLRDKIGYIFSDNAEVAMLVSTCVLPLVLYQFSDGMQCTYANALRGTANVRPLAYIAFFSYFIVSLPFSYLLAIRMEFGLTGIWYSYLLGLTTSAILYHTFFRRTMSGKLKTDIDGREENKTACR